MRFVFFCWLFVHHSVAAWQGEVTLKLAVDLSGAVDDLAGKSERFTSAASLDAVHRLRRASDAVLIGVNTVIRDDPSLTVRRVPSSRQPLRVVIDPSGRIPRDATLLNDDGPATVVFCRRCLDLRPALVEAWSEVDPLEGLLEVLWDKYAVRHLMVEGGPATACGFLAAKLVDRAVIVNAPTRFAQPVPSTVRRVAGVSIEVHLRLTPASSAAPASTSSRAVRGPRTRSTFGPDRQLCRSGSI